MPTFDLTEYLKDTDITLDGIVSPTYPEGMAYTFPSPSASRGMWMREMVQIGITAQVTGEVDPRLAELNDMDEDAELDLYREVLGSDTLDELLEDGVSWVSVQRIFGLLLRHYATGRAIRTDLHEAAVGWPAAAPLPMDEPSAKKTPARKGPAKKAPAGKAARKTAPRPAGVDD